MPSLIPKRLPCSMNGTALMFSVPPGSTIRASPHAISCNQRTPYRYHNVTGKRGGVPPKYLTTDATYGSPTFLILYENDEKDWEKMCRNVENNTWQAETMDWKPEPQARLTFRDGEEKGTPRRIETCLRMYPAYLQKPKRALNSNVLAAGVDSLLVWTPCSKSHVMVTSGLFVPEGRRILLKYVTFDASFNCSAFSAQSEHVPCCSCWGLFRWEVKKHCQT